MLDFLRKLFDTDFMPHGYCLFWNPGTLWLHVVSDALTALSYFVIPFVLVHLVRKRRDIDFSWMLVLFSVFILACGTTHLMSIWTLWHPVYRLEGLIKGITALASVPTAFLLLRLVPQVITLPSPEQLRAVNRALEFEISERRLAEERVRTANAELERRVEERTRELHEANRHLNAANERLTAMNDDLQHFSYAASHDLQEPLRMVVTFNELLKREYAHLLPPQGLEYLSFSGEAGLRMQSLLVGLREYWRASESGTDAIKMLPVEEALQQALSNLGTAIEESGAVVTHDGLPELPVDEIMFVQLFQNLISNSIKYRSEKTPRIHVSASRVGDEWKFSVTDNGVGIPAEYREVVFQVFKRLHGRDLPGIGMGLALCRKIIERCGGRIWVEDAETGAGAAFKFTLPEGRA